MWLLELSENPYVNKAVVFISSKIEHIWFLALISAAVLTALFVIIILAQIEAGRQVKSRWFTWTFCSLAIVGGLVFLKPGAKMEQIQYMPAASPVQEDIVKQDDTAAKKNISKTTSSANGSTQVEDKVAKNQAPQEGKGTAGQSQGPPSIQDKITSSLQNGKDGKVEYRDPVLEEILEQKRQAEELCKESSSEESPTQDSGDPAAVADTNQEHSVSENKDSAKEEQQAVKARVLVATLNVRDKGGLDGKIIGMLNTGDIVEVLDKNENGEWIKIKLSAGQIGWVLKNYTQILV